MIGVHVLLGINKSGIWSVNIQCINDDAFNYFVPSVLGYCQLLVEVLVKLLTQVCGEVCSSLVVISSEGFQQYYKVTFLSIRKLGVVFFIWAIILFIKSVCAVTNIYEFACVCYKSSFCYCSTP